MPITVLLADDHEVIRRGVRHVLSTYPEVMIAGEAGDFGQALEMSRALRPQVIILDMHMPGGDRIDRNHFRSQLHPSSKVLAISIWNDEETAILAEQFGAAKLIDKMDIAKDLIPAIFQLVSRSPDSSRTSSN
jgi:DNA-binding NarL/FixJ family response regulator